MTGIFLTGYAVFRSAAEVFREPDGHLGFVAGAMTMGQLLSLPMAAAGIALLVMARRSSMTALLDRIGEAGPITVERYMELALLDPDHGYYARKHPFGAAGDFVTAPEISQMFGELLGLWCYTRRGRLRVRRTRRCLWNSGLATERSWPMPCAPLNRPPARLSPSMSCLVEASARLARRQREALSGRTVSWCSAVEELPSRGPAFVIANEFFDALPVRQFVRTAAGWQERLVMVEDNMMAFVLGMDTGGLAASLPDAQTGRVCEVSPARDSLVRDLAAKLGAEGGAMLVIDFTAPGMPVRDTLQASGITGTSTV